MSHRELCSLHNGALRKPLLEILETVWSDQALRVAKAEAGMINPDAISDWDNTIWSKVPSAIQADLRRFVQSMEYDTRAVERRLTPEVRSFARSFFTIQHEASLVRPYCLLSGFLTAPDAVDLLHASPDQVDLQHEGSAAGLQLLHECVAVPGRTKYQMLFDESADGERLREACLLCRGVAVLPMLDLLLDHVGSPEDLLARGCFRSQ